MTKRQAAEALDSSKRDIMGRCDLPFGGNTVVFGGDFRQTLPDVRNGTRPQITDAMLRRPYLCESTQQLRLVHNMRAQSDPWFVEYLLRVENVIEDTVDDGYEQLLDEICVLYTDADSDINTLIESVFSMLGENLSDANYIGYRTILLTWNEYVDKISTRMVERFPREEMIYHSFDPHNYYLVEFLSS
ncbi:uncharacterized protein LOC133896998 [Phragmites australis]|uniref:uncharacterized protein LOC133896998 n=1 Tax=Phragmites australis TaxID=29695 RepID=UPI002D772C12|nr:uncharacterized protein LOC133896998 [Phragmites australis]